MSTILERLNGVQTKSYALNAADVKSYSGLRKQVSRTLDDGRKQAQEAVEKVKARTYWEIGRLIDSHVLQSQKRGDYGKQVIQRLAGDLKTNQTLLYYALQFARGYKELPASENLTWSHYRALLPLKDEKKRQDFENRVEEWGWSSRQLELAISREKTQKPQKKSDQKKTSLEFPVPVPGNYRVVNSGTGTGRLELELGFNTFFRPEKFPIKFNAGDCARMEVRSGTSQWVKVSGPKETNLYCYYAEIENVHADASILLRIDLGFGIVRRQQVKLRGIENPSGISSFKRTLREALKNTTARLMVRICSGEGPVPRADLFSGSESLNLRLITACGG